MKGMMKGRASRGASEGGRAEIEMARMHIHGNAIGDEAVAEPEAAGKARAVFDDSRNRHLSRPFRKADLVVRR